MATFTVQAEGYGTYQVEEGTKLALALEQNGVDVSHRCGGNARCTTCRIQIRGEQPPMGEAEKQCLEEDGVLGQFRLSCQIRVHQDLDVQVLMPVHSADWDNPGVDLEP
jgi:ferredoxin